MSAMDMDMVLDQKIFAEINQTPFKIAMDIVSHNHRKDSTVVPG
jgi:hypothetical protein